MLIVVGVFATIHLQASPTYHQHEDCMAEEARQRRVAPHEEVSEIARASCSDYHTSHRECVASDGNGNIRPGPEAFMACTWPIVSPLLINDAKGLRFPIALAAPLPMAPTNVAFEPMNLTGAGCVWTGFYLEYIVFAAGSGAEREVKLGGPVNENGVWAHAATVPSPEAAEGPFWLQSIKFTAHRKEVDKAPEHAPCEASPGDVFAGICVAAGIVAVVILRMLIDPKHPPPAPDPDMWVDDAPVVRARTVAVAAAEEAEPARLAWLAVDGDRSAEGGPIEEDDGSDMEEDEEDAPPRPDRLPALPGLPEALPDDWNVLGPDAPDLCPVCREHPARIVLIGCGHMLCAPCVQHLGVDLVCPECRTQPHGYQRIWR